LVAGFKKAAITKAVDALVEAGKVTGKVRKYHSMLFAQQRTTSSASLQLGEPCSPRQEFGKSKIFLPSQAGAKVLSKEEMAEKQAAIKAQQADLQAEREATKVVEQGKLQGRLQHCLM
jgi:hypothetical protein